MKSSIRNYLRADSFFGSGIYEMGWVVLSTHGRSGIPPFLPLHSIRNSTVQKSALLATIQKEIHRHDFSYFVDEPPSVTQGGKDVVVSGCPPRCKKRINTMTQFLDHLTQDLMPELIDRLSASRKSGAGDRVET